MQAILRRITLQDILVSSRSIPVASGEKDRAPIPLIHTKYLMSSVIPDDAEAWQIRRAVMTARRMAVAGRATNDRRQKILTGESALALRGLQTWNNTGDIHVHSEPVQKRGRYLEAPAVRVHEVQVPAVKIHHLRAKRLDKEVLNVQGAATVSLEEAILDLARFAHPLVAWVGICFALRWLCQFDKFRYSKSREAESQVKEKLIHMAAPLKRRRGYQRIVNLIRSTDAGVESIGEALYAYLLTVILRADESSEAYFECQYPVEEEGKQYFLDIAFPHKKLDCEFDGHGKIEDRKQIKQWIDRRHALDHAGWTPISFSSAVLTNPQRMADELTDRLSAQGFLTQPLGGYLWKPIPPELIDPMRLF